jgi:hypothetical protein
VFHIFFPVDPGTKMTEELSANEHIYYTYIQKVLINKLDYKFVFCLLSPSIGHIESALWTMTTSMYCNCRRCKLARTLSMMCLRDRPRSSDLGMDKTEIITKCPSGLLFRCHSLHAPVDLGDYDKTRSFPSKLLDDPAQFDFSANT